MHDRSLLLTAVIAIFCVSQIVSVPFIKKCKSDDSKCAKVSGQTAIPILAAGLPEYGVQTLDPVSFKTIDASSPSLKFVLFDTTVTGLKNCIAKKIKRDKTKSKIFLTLLCSANLDGNYEMNGKLLFVPIEGKGPLHVKLRKAEISAEIDLDDQTDNWKIKHWKYSFELKDKSEVVFENLFNGNEVLAQAANDLIINSGNEIITEIGLPVMDTVVNKVLETIDTFFKAVPASELSLD